MRTTLKIDDDVLRAARQIAASRGQSVGQALSDLARASLTRAAVIVLTIGSVNGEGEVDVESDEAEWGREDRQPSEVIELAARSDPAREPRQPESRWAASLRP